MLSIGCALMANPDLVPLDEPSEGLAPMVVASLVEIIREIQNFNPAFSGVHYKF